MQREKDNTDKRRLHETVLYAVVDSERKDVVTSIFYAGWMVSGLTIIFLALKYGNEAALMALLAAGVAGIILWLFNNWWKYRLYVKYSPDYKTQGQLYTGKSD
ncbi:MAG: hypothetical protein WBP44_15110 [Gammaproteobacteria bacterium]|jgi:hypothetical protein